MDRWSLVCLMLVVLEVACCFGDTEYEQQSWKNPSSPLMTQEAELAGSSGGGVGGGGSIQAFRPSQQNSVNPIDFLTAGVSPLASRYGPNLDERVSNQIASNVLRFALNIGNQLNSDVAGKSEVFSPVSIMSSLALLLLGAKGKSYHELKQLFGLDRNGLTSEQFHEQFGFMLEDLETTNIGQRTNAEWRSTQRNSIRNTKNKSPAEHTIKVANGLFVQRDYNLNPSYQKVVGSFYHSELMDLDFRRNPGHARNYINEWVEKRTYGKIQSIVSDELPKSTNLIMASALYFKAFWENSFFEAATTTDYFYPDGLDNPPVNVKMMATGGVFPYYESEQYNCRIIGLPYKGNVTTMYVIQPHHSTRGSLRELQGYLDPYKIEDMISKMTRKTAIIAFPKMHFSRNTNIKYMLQRLGVYDIFTNGISDLSLVSDRQSYNMNIPPPPPPPQLMAPAPTGRTRKPLQQPIIQPQQQITMSFPEVQSEGLPVLQDRYGEKPSIFSRSSFLSEGGNQQPTQYQNTTGYRSQGRYIRSKRQTSQLRQLDAQRNVQTSAKSDLYVEDIVHKVDFDVNEHGTEAAAATLTYLRRTGTDVLFRAETPFLILIRHDPTKLVLFYGIINEPVL